MIPEGKYDCVIVSARLVHGESDDHVNWRLTVMAGPHLGETIIKRSSLKTNRCRKVFLSDLAYAAGIVLPSVSSQTLTSVLPELKAKPVVVEMKRNGYYAKVAFVHDEYSAAALEAERAENNELRVQRARQLAIKRYEETGNAAYMDDLQKYEDGIVTLLDLERRLA